MAFSLHAVFSFLKRHSPASARDCKLGVKIIPARPKSLWRGGALWALVRRPGGDRVHRIPLYS
jgi:hypothetical protein